MMNEYEIAGREVITVEAEGLRQTLQSIVLAGCDGLGILKYCKGGACGYATVESSRGEHISVIGRVKVKDCCYGGAHFRFDAKKWLSTIMSVVADCVTAHAEYGVASDLYGGPLKTGLMAEGQKTLESEA
jgi:hypothetical protein